MLLKNFNLHTWIRKNKRDINFNKHLLKKKKINKHIKITLINFILFFFLFLDFLKNKQRLTFFL